MEAIKTDRHTTHEKSSIMNISEHQQAMENFKAFYYLVNAKPDCKSIVYGKNIKVDKENLVDLSEKIVNKFKNHYKNDYSNEFKNHLI